MTDLARLSAIYYLAAPVHDQDAVEPIVEHALANRDLYESRIHAFANSPKPEATAIMLLALAEVDLGAPVAETVRTAVTMARDMISPGVAKMVNAVMHRLLDSGQPGQSPRKTSRPIVQEDNAT